jgi:hypothetical protein
VETTATEVAFAVTVAEFMEAVPVAEGMEMEDFVELTVGRAEMLRLRDEREMVPLVGFDVLVSGVVDCRVMLVLVLVSSVVGFRVALALVLAALVLAALVLAVVELTPPPPLAAETIVQEVAAPFPSRTQVNGCGRVGVQARLVKLWRYLLARKVKRVFPTPGSGVA